MTKRELMQENLIELLENQLSKVNLESEVTEEINNLRRKIRALEVLEVPFVDEVEEFNATMGKPNNYEPIIPEEKEWKFVYNFILEELEEYRETCEKGDIVEVLDALCDITYVSLVTVLCYIALKIRYGQHIKKYKRLICLKHARLKKRLNKQ